MLIDLPYKWEAFHTVLKEQVNVMNYETLFMFGLPRKCPSSKQFFLLSQELTYLYQHRYSSENQQPPIVNII
jgi:hypothetical protein